MEERTAPLPDPTDLLPPAILLWDHPPLCAHSSVQCQHLEPACNGPSFLSPHWATASHLWASVCTSVKWGLGKRPPVVTHDILIWKHFFPSIFLIVVKGDTIYVSNWSSQLSSFHFFHSLYPITKSYLICLLNILLFHYTFFHPHCFYPKLTTSFTWVTQSMWMGYWSYSVGNILSPSSLSLYHLPLKFYSLVY